MELFAGMCAKMQDMGRLMRITGGNVGQLSEEEMKSLVGAKKRVPQGMCRRYKRLEQRTVASAEEAQRVAMEEQQARLAAVAALTAAASGRGRATAKA